VRFAGKIDVGGEGGSWYKRWDGQFGFLESRDDATDNLPAILGAKSLSRGAAENGIVPFAAAHNESDKITRVTGMTIF
jgi:hypothetical protein